MNDASGPTVAEYHQGKAQQINRQIEELQQQKRRSLLLIQQYGGSKTTEAERIATAAEPLQTTQLPQ